MTTTPSDPNLQPADVPDPEPAPPETDPEGLPDTESQPGPEGS